VTAKRDYQPFGEEIPSSMGGRPSLYDVQTEIRQQFTGKERDAETGLDYSIARYLSASQGRFTSPDAPLVDQDVVNPQSWNLYSYVRNNPLRGIDPSGRKCVQLTGGFSGVGDDGEGEECPDVIGGASTTTTVRVTSYEAGLIMLQGIGQGLSSPHQIATIVSEGGQAATAIEGLRGLPALWRAFRSMYAGSGLIELGIAGGNGGVLADAKFAQKSASAVFSIEGKFAGRSVEEVATALRNGTLHPSDVPVEYVICSPRWPRTDTQYPLCRRIAEGRDSSVQLECH
jgi:RHS repeat-associated protein